MRREKMAKIIDITDKLKFEENPKLVIKGEEFEVNTDAATVIEIIGAFEGDDEAKAVVKAYEKLFSVEAWEKLAAKKFSMTDLRIRIKSAMELVQGGDDAQGE